MSVRIELLEFIQCVLAKMLGQCDKPIQPCLINKTGFYSVVYQAEPALINQQLTELIQQALIVTQHQLVVIVSEHNKHLELALYADDSTQIVSKCTTPEKAIYSQAINIPEALLVVETSSVKMDTLLNAFRCHSPLHFTQKQQTPSHSEAMQVELLDLTDETPEIVNYVSVDANTSRLSCVNMTTASTQDNNHVALFWPFYDTDIINMINNQTAPEPLSILVADDSMPSLVATKAMLEKLGCKVTTASDGIIALALAEQHPFDLLLLDERMPGLYGSQVAEKLIAQDGTNRLTPKVSLTGLTEPDEIQQLFNKGITHYLEKPVTKLALEQFLIQWQS